MDNTQSTPAPPVRLADAFAWWSGLSDPWKRAFNEAALKRSGSDILPDDVLLTVYASPAHRFAGPLAPYPNMSFELEDLSGLVGLPNAQIVVVIYQKLTHVRELAKLGQLRSLFLYNNQIETLEGIEHCTELTEVHIQCNNITSLRPLEQLVNMKSLYCCYNQLSNFEGIGEQHVERLEDFYCLPNSGIKDAAAMKFEREVGIRCKKG